MRPERNELLWIPLVLAAALAIYLPGLGNPPLFDDQYLASGQLFTDYGVFTELRTRVVSYSSFGWVQALAGEGWWKQRVVNLAIHVGVVFALWGFYREVLRHVVVPAPAEPDAPAPIPAPRSPALALGIGFFALNPVAVYAVAYLIQRSILLATLFVVVGLWLVARAAGDRRWWLLAPALACYVIAVASKEHAVLAPLAAIPVYILCARPGRKALAILAIAGLAATGLVVQALRYRYGEIIGKPFDEYSHVYLAQLAKLAPDAPENAFGLSVMNQAWLFFEYGFRWMLPWSGWMSINLRPPFPVSFATFPQVLGIAGYLAAVAGGFVLLLRYRDARAIAGLALLLATLLFATEFVTVWVQDPFVLYRSYLWAIGIPGLVFVIFNGLPWKAAIPVGAIVVAAFTWQGIDRVFSLTSPEVAWTDAIAKLPDDARSVGRWFPYLNRGADRFERDQMALAQRDFEASATLGDLGMGAMNLGALLSAQGRHAQALAAFDEAEKQGYRLYNLHVQRGLALVALRRPVDAYRALMVARSLGPPSPTRELVLLNLGRIALQEKNADDAVSKLEELLDGDPKHAEARYNLGMAYVAKGDAARAKEILDKLIAEEPSGRAHYARALAHYGLRQKAAALADLEEARKRVGDSPHLREWDAKIRALP